MNYYTIPLLAFFFGLFIASALWWVICLVIVKLYKELSIGYDNLYEDYNILKQQLKTENE